jgi:cobalt-zinc-cadmium efflux system membrane fusion protein
MGLRSSLPARTGFALNFHYSRKPGWKWLNRAAAAVGLALIGASAAIAQTADPARRAEISIPMSEQSIRAAGILTAKINPSQGKSDLSFPGTVVIPQHQIRVIAAPVGGIIEALMVGQDESVTEGQVVAQVRSPDLVEAQRLYLGATSDDALASDKLRRARLLFEGKAMPERDLRIAESEAAVAHAKLDERTQLLFLFGMEKTEFDTLQSSRMIVSAMTVRSPVNGTIVTRHAGVGEQIKATAPLFTLGVLDPLYVNIQVPAQRLSAITVGAHVTVPAYRVEGKIIRIGRTVDQATQSAIAVAEVESGGGRLRPGLAVSTRILVEQALPATANKNWIVPAASVVRHRDQSWVFLRGTGGFRATPVQVLDETARNVSIRVDFNETDEVATRGVLALLSELAEADQEN